MSRYASGQPVRLSTTVKDITGTLVNAGALSLAVKKPDATTSTFNSPTNDSTGLYHQDLSAADLAQNGHFLYVWTSTGTGAGVSRGDFDVFDPFEPAVLSLEDAKVSLNIPVTNTTNDSEIQSMIDTVNDVIEMVTGGPLVTRTVVERVQVSGDYRTLTLRKRPVVAVTSIVDVAGSIALPLDNLDVDTNSGIIRRQLGLAFFSRGPYYTVTYTAGWGSALPAGFSTAARMIVGHLWATQRGPQFRPELGDETFLPGMSFAIPNRALEILQPYSYGVFV